MKFTTTLVALAAVASQAAAVKTHSAHPADISAYSKGLGHCLTPGAPCHHTKRAAEAVAEALADPKKKKIKGGQFNFCGVPGSSCARKRDLVEQIGARAEQAYEAIEAREAEADPKKKKKIKGGQFNFCGVPGSSCARKREAEADAEADAEPKKVKGGLFNFCGVPGSSCARKRDVVDDILSKISDVSPNAEAAECYSEGAPCDQIVQAAKSFNAIRAREAEAKSVSAAHKMAYGGPFMAEAAKAHLKAVRQGKVMAREAEAECESGPCAVAARALKSLEEAIEEGVASLEE